MTIAVLFDRAVTLALNDVQSPLVYTALHVATWIAFVYGFAALMGLFAGRDPVALLREGWLRLLRTLLVAIVPVLAAFAIAATAGIVVLELASVAVPRAVAVIGGPVGSSSTGRARRRRS